MFAYWLDPIDVDGEKRYPNINIVEGVLQYLKNLQFDGEELRDSQIYKVVDFYSESANREINPIARKLAQEIINKWNLGNIGYNEDHQYEESGYNKFQKGLDEFIEKHVPSEEEESSGDEEKKGEEE